ncbi:hypothetical protein [Sphaerisporangium flaviroseum]|uniref:hypothetical protein n=1 Tax=Sphaerisporangium flaviroseum TaxID=509199 RepID=UPI0031E9FB15
MKMLLPTLLAFGLIGVAVVASQGSAPQGEATPLTDQDIGQVTPQSLVDQLKDKGYSCEPRDTVRQQLGMSQANVAQCGGSGTSVVAFVYYSREEQLQSNWPADFNSLVRSDGRAIFKNQQALVYDTTYPHWEVICFDQGCVDAGRQLGWLEVAR